MCDPSWDSYMPRRAMAHTQVYMRWKRRETRAQMSNLQRAVKLILNALLLLLCQITRLLFKFNYTRPILLYLDWSRSGSWTSRTRTKPTPNPGFRVRCSRKVEHEPLTRCRFSLFLNLHPRFEPGCTSVHPVIVYRYIYVYIIWFFITLKYEKSTTKI